MEMVPLALPQFFCIFHYYRNKIFDRCYLFTQKRKQTNKQRNKNKHKGKNKQANKQTKQNLDLRHRHGCIFFTLSCHLVHNCLTCSSVYSHPSCLCYSCRASYFLYLVLCSPSIFWQVYPLVFCLPIWPPGGVWGIFLLMIF